MTWIMVDVESDGPCPGLYSMVSLGAVVIDAERKLDQTFYGQFEPISDKWVPEALAVSGHTREECLAFPNPDDEMQRFDDWVREVCGTRKGRNGKEIPDARFISDNNGFDWQWVNYYFHACVGDNPFGFSSTNLGSLYKGRVNNMFKNFKHLRKTRHTHHPVMDAKGNAEALYAMMDAGLRFKL
jgi:hypothetical protein